MCIHTFRAWSIFRCGITICHLQRARAAYILTQLEHDNGESGSFSTRQCVRVVKEKALKSIGLCPQGFESSRCRSCSDYVALGKVGVDVFVIWLLGLVV